MEEQFKNILNTELLVDAYVNDTLSWQQEIQLLTRDPSIKEVREAIN